MSAKAPLPIRVAVVEDDDRLRASFVSRLERADGFRCVAAFASAEQALLQLAEAAPQVVLMDINLPGKSGIDCVRELKLKHPAIQFLMLTVYEDVDMIFRALQAGATGYLLKRSVPEELLDAIRDLQGGGAPMTSLIARKVVESFARKPPAESDRQAILTPREREIVEALAQGCPYKEIADRCGISLSTVRTHLQRVYEKLQVNNRTEAVVKFLGR
ncbi:MAG TPA: response regulator transcription factor [Candidatus Limnocylindria bacterium]|jgi:DNA-binding NarL/FixJ family response regulator|nr:response regulator transcription factor [Candidatus Limnocylindria bacterium]